MLWMLPAASASADDTVTLTSPPSTTNVWVFSPTPDQLVGLTKIEIVSTGQEARTVGIRDFLESLKVRGVAYVSFVGTVEDPDHPPMVIPTFPSSTAQLILYRDNTRLCPGADQEPTEDNLPLMRSATLCLINLERKAVGLKPLRIQAQLQKASQAFARQMVREHFFDHTDSRGVGAEQRLRKVGYIRDDLRDLTAGENIGVAGGGAGEPRFMVEAWMNSEGHKESMLDELFVDIGVGIAPRSTRGGPGATYVTDFGKRWFYPKKKKKKKKRASAVARPLVVGVKRQVLSEVPGGLSPDRQAHPDF